jgi:hypothetical protein
VPNEVAVRLERAERKLRDVQAHQAVESSPAHRRLRTPRFGNLACDRVSVQPMTSDDVLRVFACFDAARIHVWVDGGWAVEVLVGEETRRHADLDLALDRTNLGRARDVLEERGYRRDTAPSRDSRPGS